MIDLMVENPFETRSDSFYFVENTLVMHNKEGMIVLPISTNQSKDWLDQSQVKNRQFDSPCF